MELHAHDHDPVDPHPQGTVALFKATHQLGSSGIDDARTALAPTGLAPWHAAMDAAFACGSLLYMPHARPRLRGRSDGLDVVIPNPLAIPRRAG